MQNAKLSFAATILSLTVAPCLAPPARADPPWSEEAETEVILQADLEARLAAELAELRGLTFDELLALHPRAAGASPEAEPPFDVAGAAHYSTTVGALALPEAATAALQRDGFVVVPGSRTNNAWLHPAHLYYDVFRKDLPVYVTADSILFAWHRIYDRVLRQSERRVTFPALHTLLKRFLRRAKPKTQGERDAVFFLEVAKGLIDTERYFFPASATYDGQRSKAFFRHSSVPDPGSSAIPVRLPRGIRSTVRTITRYRRAKIELFGRERTIDFSGFSPRGHYADSGELRAYFKAMTWLSRVGFEIYDPASDRIAPREEEAARALMRLLFAGGTPEELETVFALWSSFVGRTPRTALPEIWRACERAGIPGCIGSEKERLAVYRAAARDINAGAFHEKPVLSSTLVGLPAPLDSFVLSQLTMPRLPIHRALFRFGPRELDIGFALGFADLLPFYDEEMFFWSDSELPARLEAVQRVVRAVDPWRFGDSIQSHWWGALAAMGRAQSVNARATAMPWIFSTPAFRRRSAEGALASWAEMRRDNILLVDETRGMGGCFFPAGYVDPVPELYEELAVAAGLLAKAAARLPMEKYPTRADTPAGRVNPFFEPLTALARWPAIMARLADIARREREGYLPAGADLEFLRQTISRQSSRQSNPYVPHIRVYDGWYTELFATRISTDDDLLEDDPVIADVASMLDVRTGGAKTLYFSAATGNPGIMIVAIDDGKGGATLHAGPVSSAYWLASGRRFTDQQWRSVVWTGEAAPFKPDWARVHWVEDTPPQAEAKD